MYDSVRVVHDLDECAELWQRNMPQESLTDLWEVRYCFHRHFERPPHFLAAESGNQITGLLPLSWIEEQGCYGYFPGETWRGKTWLEQNRVIWNGEVDLETLLGGAFSPHHLRYLLPLHSVAEESSPVDEIGYLFMPPRYDYNFQNYLDEFSHKSLKRIRKELAALESQGVGYRYDCSADFELMVEMNLQRFGSYSYFADHRFHLGFKSLAQLLEEKGWLRFTTVLIGGEPAAIDMGCLHDDVYTVLAGGTSERFPGAAKLINLHHLERACGERRRLVDFLCGDFHWKIMFHLTPRPLYLISNYSIHHEIPAPAEVSCELVHDA